jgi:hypothetical protein
MKLHGDPMQKSSSALPILLIILLILCCCLIVLLGSVWYLFDQARQRLPTSIFPVDNHTPTPFEVTRKPPDETDAETLLTLQNTLIPSRDLAALACRFNHVCNAPETLDPPAIPYVIGSERQFWLSNSDDGVYSRITATLEYLTPHAYFWVEKGVSFDRQEAQALMDTFEEKIYPTNRAFFGSEWTPGVDNDPHLYIIYAKNLGASVAGFYVSIDEYNPLVVEYSNGIEAFYIDSSQDLGDEYTYSTLAHEFQHMIHWYQDANESSFLDEGFAELASFLNGYDTGGADWTYTNNPDLALTDWEESGSNYAHYGANFLFVTYFLDRFGDQATQALIHNPDNELDSVDSTLEQLGITDPLTNQPITADDFFLDWVIANYVHDESVADGRYYYHNYPGVPTASDTEIVSICPQGPVTRTVNQYGVDYIGITCSGDYTIRFSGATLTPLLSTDPHSGDYTFWSNKANESNTSLERAFDLSAVSGPVTLEYWVWYDIETDYDYAYLTASTDGENWEILITPSGSGEDPTGSSYGWGYTGQSGNWTQETVDLSRFAGQTVWLRFDYVTDAAVIEQGLLLDDISIPEINYFEDFESGDGGWEAAGFARIQNILPQTFRLALIRNTGDGTSVEIIPVGAAPTAEKTVSSTGRPPRPPQGGGT